MDSLKNLKPFPKGVSGNKKGRPKNSSSKKILDAIKKEAKVRGTTYEKMLASRFCDSVIIGKNLEFASSLIKKFVPDLTLDQSKKDTNVVVVSNIPRPVDKPAIDITPETKKINE